MSGYRTLWFFLLLGWTVSAADRAAALLFGASTFFNAMQPIAQAMLADIADPAHHGAAFGMNNLIGEIGAVLSPAVSGALREASASRVLRSGRFDRAEVTGGARVT